jgi:hypothetical protein
MNLIPEIRKLIEQSRDYDRSNLSPEDNRELSFEAADGHASAERALISKRKTALLNDALYFLSKLERIQ